MHHSGGAFSETIYIYEPAVIGAFERFEKPVIVSVGLGLGYNEILVAVQAMKRGQSCELVSFESDRLLREAFCGFVGVGFDSAGGSLKTTESSLNDVYRKICRYFEVDESEIRKWFADSNWQCQPALEGPAQLPEVVHGFLWDAFSKKTTPELWEESFLIESFRRGAIGCQLATYASNSALKRSLKTSGYDLEIREGFQGKRNATQAIRRSHL